VRTDTIAAPATAPGEAGIAVIRVSGPEALAAAGALFDRPLRDRRTVFGHVRDPETGEVVDEAVGILMRAPRSFTREDVVELHCHGSALVMQRVMALLLRRGVRAAEPGEFTLRAFLSGRIDLARAEAVLDVIQARTHAAQRVAMASLRGRVSAAVGEIREDLLAALAYLVARIDFPDEDVPEEDVAPALERAARAIERLLAGAQTGALYRTGARVALIGPPNAGKSSLLNRLLREDRAIVTPVAGTTRDTLAEAMNLHGIPVVLTDTAGLSASAEPIEAMGVERTRRAAADADALLIVLDRSRPAPVIVSELVALAEGRPALVALNKSDLPPALASDGLPAPVVTVSALRGDGIDALETALYELLTRQAAPGEAEVLIANPRHGAALDRALAQIRAALEGLSCSLAEDFISIDVRAALDALGEITGETAGDDVLDAIFKRFCIGK
jgi:tRNA modification GTPase